MTTNADMNREVDCIIDDLGERCHAYDRSDAELIIDKLRERLDEVILPAAIVCEDEDVKMNAHRVFAR